MVDNMQMHFLYRRDIAGIITDKFFLLILISNVAADFSKIGLLESCS